MAPSGIETVAERCASMGSSTKAAPESGAGAEAAGAAAVALSACGGASGAAVAVAVTVAGGSVALAVASAGRAPAHPTRSSIPAANPRASLATTMRPVILDRLERVYRLERAGDEHALRSEASIAERVRVDKAQVEPEVEVPVLDGVVREPGGMIFLLAAVVGDLAVVVRDLVVVVS